MTHQDRDLQSSLRDFATHIALTIPPPPAAQVWLRAAHRRRREDLNRIERPMRIMQAVAVLCALVLAIWLTQHTTVLVPLAAVRSSLLFAACATAATALAVCWAMLRISRRTSWPSHHKPLKTSSVDAS